MTTDLTPEHTARHPDSDSYSEVIAAYQYVQSVIPTADVQSSAGGYAWHGWALREAFLAGCTHARAALADEPAVPEGREPGTWTEGVCGDGAALLKDGVMVPIEAVVRELNEGARARAALYESCVSDYKVASEDTMRRIRSTTKRWRVSVIISTNDSSIDTRIGCGIWKCLDIEREILESVSLPEYLAIKENAQ